MRKPVVVLVVGASNKSFFKEKLKNAASEKGLDIKKKDRLYNTRFGIALNALDLPTVYGNKFNWIWVYLLSFYKFFYNLFFLPKYMFLEAGIDEEGEAGKFLRLLYPKAVVFGSIEHSLTDDFEALDVIEREYSKMVNYLNEYAKENPIVEEEGSFEDMIDFLQQKQYYFGVINTQDKKIAKLGEKLIRKFYIDFNFE